MFFFICNGVEHDLAAMKHYDDLRGGKDVLVFESQYNNLYLSTNGQILDQHGNFVFDLPRDPVLKNLTEIIRWVDEQ
jgi:hypothetical protein